MKKAVDRSAQQWYHTNCCGGNAETTEPERYRQSGNHPDDPGTESKKDEKKYLTNPKDFDKISELLRKRQSNIVWYDLRSSKELQKKFKKVLDKHKEMC